jgi:hypothetical protein
VSNLALIWAFFTSRVTEGNELQTGWTPWNHSNKFIKRSFFLYNLHKWPSSNHLQEMYIIWWYRRTWATIY